MFQNIESLSSRNTVVFAGRKIVLEVTAVAVLHNDDVISWQRYYTVTLDYVFAVA